MTLDINTKSSVTYSFTISSRRVATGSIAPATRPSPFSHEPAYARLAADPEFSTADATLNPYSRGFLIFWLLGLLAATGAHFINV